MNSPRTRSAVDPTVSLCLACSSSLPPRKALASPTPPNAKTRLPTSDEIFLTECCRRPICPACVRANPRLVRYNPCLHCLGGVGAVSAAARSLAAADGPKSTRGYMNVDGGVRDEDVFVLEDDDEESEDGEGTGDGAHGEEGKGDNASTASDSPPPATPPPAYTDITSPAPSPSSSSSRLDLPQAPDPAPSASTGPQRYYIRPHDTLVGIALRFHVDGRTLCRLNGLPPSTLRTTPHLLHTRTFLDLPAGARGSGLASSSLNNRPSPADEARRARERAESRFRALTKEADYRVARAYVAVAGVEDDAADAFREDEVKKAAVSHDASESLRKRHPASPVEARGGLEGRAVDRYLDDEEWEARQRHEGRRVAIPAFPLFSGAGKSPNVNGKTWCKW